MKKGKCAKKGRKMGGKTKSSPAVKAINSELSATKRKQKGMTY